MQRSIIFMLSTLILSTVSSAQSQPAKTISQGNKAILFNFTGLSTIALTGYQGGIGAKYFLSDEMAVRAMLDFGLNNTTTKGTAGFKDATNDITAFGIGGGLEYHLPISTSVSPYLGGVVSFITNNQTITPTVPNGVSATQNKITTTTFGLGAIAGVEYFFNQNLSLGAEYQFGFSTASSSSTGTQDQSTLQLGFQTVGLTLGVYF